jgi:hypothetical protein
MFFLVPRNTVHWKEATCFLSLHYLGEFCAVNNLLLLTMKHAIHVCDVITDNNTYLFTPWSRIPLEKVTGSRNSPYFMEPEASLPHSQVPATSPYPEPGRSSPYPTSQFLKTHLKKIILPITPAPS